MGCCQGFIKGEVYKKICKLEKALFVHSDLWTCTNFIEIETLLDVRSKNLTFCTNCSDFVKNKILFKNDIPFPYPIYLQPNHILRFFRSGQSDCEILN